MLTKFETRILRWILRRVVVARALPDLFRTLREEMARTYYEDNYATRESHLKAELLNPKAYPAGADDYLVERLMAESGLPEHIVRRSLAEAA